MSKQEDKVGCIAYLKALSDENRYKIVKLLVSEVSSLTLGEIAKRLGLSDYNASKHVRILCEAGILRIEREGRFKNVSVEPEFVSKTQKKAGEDELDLGCCKFDFRKSEI